MHTQTYKLRQIHLNMYTYVCIYIHLFAHILLLIFTVCIEMIQKTQWSTYTTALEKTTCKAEQRRLLAKGMCVMIMYYISKSFESF
jgi:hypothetical protein